MCKICYHDSVGAGFPMGILKYQCRLSVWKSVLYILHHKLAAGASLSLELGSKATAKIFLLLMHIFFIMMDKSTQFCRRWVLKYKLVEI